MVEFSTVASPLDGVAGWPPGDGAEGARSAVAAAVWSLPLGAQVSFTERALYASTCKDHFWFQEQDLDWLLWRRAL